MKIGPSKKKVGDFFLSYGWLVLFLAILCYGGFSYAINAIDAIKDYEKIDYFLECYGVAEDNALGTDTVGFLKDGGVLESNVYTTTPTSSDRSSQFDRYGAYSDICLLTGKDLDDLKEVIADNFQPLTAEFKGEIISSSLPYSYYAAYGNDYGIKIYDPEDTAYSSLFSYSSLLTFEKEGQESNSYYLVVPIRSVNYGKDTDNGYKALKRFLSIYEAAA